MIHTKRSTCRICNSDQLYLFLSLGKTPLANSFIKSPDDASSEAAYPLDVYICRQCFLVQLLDVIDPEVLFRDYIYVTGTSDTITEHNKKYAREVATYLELAADDLVLEVASNDGSLLKNFKNIGVGILGVEPATNIAQVANQNGINTINAFFNLHSANEILGMSGPARAVIGNNVLAHVDDTLDFLLGCKRMLSRDGMVIIEVPYLLELLERLEYDTIYHEHLCYFSVSTLLHLCDQVGLSLQRMDRVPVHGGSIRMYAGLPDYYGVHEQSVVEMAQGEQSLGLNDIELYDKFAANVEKSKIELRMLLEDITREGKTVAGYGAPAKGNTLLNYCDIGTAILPYTVDKNPWKVGLYTPGMHIPILQVDAIMECKPDYVLILAWNFADEIIKQQDDYRKRGGKFILPLPAPRIV